MEKDKIIIYCDGGSRGNPGPAAIGCFIEMSNEQRVMKEYSKFLGMKTNNEAEYQAAIFALKKIKHLIGGKKTEKTAIEIRMDSELIVSQLNGKYKIKEKTLVPFFIEIWNLKQDFGEVKFVQVSREENKEADRLVNKELNNKISLF